LETFVPDTRYTPTSPSKIGLVCSTCPLLRRAEKKLRLGLTADSVITTLLGNSRKNSTDSMGSVSAPSTSIAARTRPATMGILPAMSLRLKSTAWVESSGKISLAASCSRSKKLLRKAGASVGMPIMPSAERTIWRMTVSLKRMSELGWHSSRRPAAGSVT